MLNIFNHPELCGGCCCLQVKCQKHILKLQAWAHLRTLNLSLSSMQTGKPYNSELWSTCKKWDPWNSIDWSVKKPWTCFYKLQNGAALTCCAWIGNFLNSGFDFRLAWIGDFLGPSMCCFTKTLVFQNWADSLWSLMLSSSAFFQYMAWAYWASLLHLLHLFTQFSGAVQ